MKKIILVFLLCIIPLISNSASSVSISGLPDGGTSLDTNSVLIGNIGSSTGTTSRFTIAQLFGLYFGTITTDKWCYGSGGKIICTKDAPQTLSTNLTSLAGLTFADVSIIQLTGVGTSAVLTSGGAYRYIRSNSDNSALEISADLLGSQVTIHATTAETTPNDSDEILIYSVGSSANRRMTRGNFLGTINAATLDSGTWATPGTIGASSPNTGAFTTVTATGLSCGGIVLGDTTPDADGEYAYNSNSFRWFANSEDFILTATTNIWTISSNTGVDTLSLGAIALKTTGDITGKLPVRDVSRNLIIANVALHPDHQLNITADEVILQTTSGDARRFTGLSDTLDADVSGANGVDTGTISNAWHYIWAIAKTDGTLDTLLSLQSDIARITFPSGYTYAALLGAVYAGASATFDLLVMQQVGNRVEMAATTVLSAGSSATYATIGDLAAVVPPNANKIFGYGKTINTTADVTATLYLSPSSTGAIGTILMGGTIAANDGYILTPFFMGITETTPALYYKVTGAGTTSDVVVTGWEF